MLILAEAPALPKRTPAAVDLLKWLPFALILNFDMAYMWQWQHMHEQ